MVGQTLWSYRIESKIGAGGMGVVYKAIDSRLDRTVAIKVLPATALSNPDRQKRFVQEAKTASSLNHPNIITIYDINTQEVDGQPVQYIAMEYVAGETLDKLIGRKGLRVRDALKCAIQIADALAAAHAAGIVHRDLKPSNVMITQQGLVKILDFGLAKLSGPLEADAYAETVHAQAGPVTEEGTVLGTVAYMSPEQADGKKIDPRSDIFSFGSVLYEMITGKQAFAGSSKLSSLSAVMYKEPQPVSQVVPEVHPELERVISRCLKKEPERRWQTMADVKVALEELRDEVDSSNIVAAPKPGARKLIARLSARSLVLGALLGLSIAAAAITYFAPRFVQGQPPSYQRLTFRRGDVTSARFAPGGAVVYSAQWDGAPSNLYSVIPGNREARPLQLPSGRVMAISASGEMAILLGDDPSGTLARVPFSGGAPREILENVFFADWGPDGESMAVVRKVGSHYRLEYPVGTVLYETDLHPPEHPRVSPDGKLVAFFDSDLEVGDFALSVIGPHHPKQMLSRGWRAQGWLEWSPKGDEIWFSATQSGDPGMYAINLSGQQRVVLQAPAWIIMQDVARDGRVLFDAVNSRLGILYIPPDGSAQRDLAWLDASLAYDLSQDARSLILVELGSGEGRNAAIYLRKTDGSPAVRLGYGNRPALSPDGKWVVCILRQPARSQLLLLPTGPGESRLLDVEDAHYESVEWFPDGKRILFTGNQTGHSVRTWMYDLDGGAPKPVTPEGVKASRVSPDGKSVVIVDPRKLLLADLAGGTPKAVMDLQPGEKVARWSGDGRYVFVFRAEGETITINRLDVAQSRREPWRVLRVPEAGAGFYGSATLSPDGKAIVATFQHDLGNLFLVKGLK